MFKCYSGHFTALKINEKNVVWSVIPTFSYISNISSHHLTYPLTVRVVGAPQMITQPVSSIFPCSPLPLGFDELQASVHSLMLSSHLFLCLPCLLPPLNVPCEMVLARPGERETWPYHCSLSLLTMVRRPSCGPIACWILARTSSLVTGSLYEMRSLAPHFHGLYSSLELCCESPWFTSIQEDVCDKEVRQLYLVTERNTPVIPNWFQPCQCCCCLCYLKYLNGQTLASIIFLAGQWLNLVYCSQHRELSFQIYLVGGWDSFSRLRFDGF